MHEFFARLTDFTLDLALFLLLVVALAKVIVPEYRRLKRACFPPKGPPLSR
jgi:hypothetical protein